MNFQEEQHLINKVDKVDKNIDLLIKQLEFKKALEFAEEFIAEIGIVPSIEKTAECAVKLIQDAGFNSGLIYHAGKLINKAVIYKSS